MEEQVLAVATVAARAAVKVAVWKAMATPAADRVEEVMAVAQEAAATMVEEVQLARAIGVAAWAAEAMAAVSTAGIWVEAVRVAAGTALGRSWREALRPPLPSTSHSKRPQRWTTSRAPSSAQECTAWGQEGARW